MKTKQANALMGVLLLLGTAGTWASVFTVWAGNYTVFHPSFDVPAKVFAGSALVLVTLALILQCCSKREFKTMVCCVCSVGVLGLVSIIVFAATSGATLQTGYFIMLAVTILFCLCGCCLLPVKVDDMEDLRKLLASADPAVVQAALTAVLMQVGGFQMCTDAVKYALNATLRRVGPTGGTSLYDAIAQGTLHILKLQALLLQLGVRQQKFIHVIVTDGEDTNSKLNLDECCELMRQIAPHSAVVETVIIAVGMSAGTGGYRALQRLASAGGAACKILDVDSANIGDVLQRITATISRTIRVNVVPGENVGNHSTISNRSPLLQATQSTDVELNVNFFAVFLDLDMSGSMSGARWNSLTAGVSHLLDNLTVLDAVGCVLFNTDTQLITKS